MTCPCCQLHVHSSYSMRDGMNTPDELAIEAKAKGMTGLGLTDHGVLFGAPAFAKACGRHGLKPVFGMEAYEAAVPWDFDIERDGGPFQKKWADMADGEYRYFHLTLWALDATGWANLCTMHTLAHAKDHKPRNQALVDRKMLSEHSDGILIGLGCLASRTSQVLERSSYDARAGYEAAKFYVDLVGRDRVVMELTNNTAEQMRAIRPQRQVAEMLGIRCMAVNDVHYTRRSYGAEGGPHHVLVQSRAHRSADVEATSGDKSDDGYGQWYGTDGLFMKDGDEMLADGGLIVPDLETTMAVLDSASFDFSQLPMPKPPVAAVPAPGDDPLFDLWLAQQAA